MFGFIWSYSIHGYTEDWENWIFPDFVCMYLYFVTQPFNHHISCTAYNIQTFKIWQLQCCKSLAVHSMSTASHLQLAFPYTVVNVLWFCLCVQDLSMTSYFPTTHDWEFVRTLNFCPQRDKIFPGRNMATSLSKSNSYVAHCSPSFM